LEGGLPLEKQETSPLFFSYLSGNPLFHES
jgi:hypothetical protein